MQGIVRLGGMQCTVRWDRMQGTVRLRWNAGYSKVKDGMQGAIRLRWDAE